MNSEIELRDHVLVGPLRRSVNNARNIAGSIHDDATATKLGFRGGTVAGSIHMELFPPLLLKAFGKRWFERGTLSMYFLNATTDREAVRAFIKEPPHDASDGPMRKSTSGSSAMTACGSRKARRRSEASRSRPH